MSDVFTTCLVMLEKKKLKLYTALFINENDGLKKKIATEPNRAEKEMQRRSNKSCEASFPHNS